MNMHKGPSPVTMYMYLGVDILPTMWVSWKIEQFDSLPTNCWVYIFLTHQVILPMQALRLSFISARIRTWNLSAPLFRILGFKSNYMECSDLYIDNCKDDTCVHIYIYSWNPNDPCCEWKWPSFGGFKPKIEDKRVPGLYIYIIYIYVDVTYIQGILAFCCPVRLSDCHVSWYHWGWYVPASATQTLSERKVSDKDAPTWRIVIPLSKWLITMVSPLFGDVPLPNHLL